MECPKCEARSWGARCVECGEQLIPDSLQTTTGLALDVRPVARAAAHVSTDLPGGRDSVVTPPRRSPTDFPLLVLSYRWSERAWHLMLIAAVLFLCGLRLPLLPRLGVGALVAVCLYAAAAYRLNATTFRVEKRTLHIESGPLPWRRARQLPIADIDQIFVRTTYGSKRENPFNEWNKARVVVTTYGVVAALRVGGEVTLLSGRDDIGEAISLERRLETHLGIVDDGTRSVVD